MLANRLPSESLPDHPQEEVVLANFGTWQIAVPTTQTLVKKHLFSVAVPLPERTYFSQGWAIYQERIFSSLRELKVGSVARTDSPFKHSPRLSPGVPLDFELVGDRALPTPVTLLAQFVCDWDGEFCGAFRGVRPRFVRIYPFAGLPSLEHAVRQLLVAERAFVADNRDRLSQIPFYRESFDL